jgi:hypothetical protein
VRDFTCAACGETFKIDVNWTEEQKRAEYEQTFGLPLHPSELDVVCDDCYPLIVAWAQNRGLV